MGSSATSIETGSSIPDMPWFTQEQLTRFSEFLTGDAARDQRNIQALLGTVAVALGETDLDTMLAKLVDHAIRSTGSERGILLLFEEGQLGVRVGRDRMGRDLGPRPEISQKVPRAVALKGTPIQDRVASDGAVLDLTESVHAMRLRQVMCAPLTARGRTLGVMYVDSTVGGPAHSPADLMLFNAQAGLMAMSIENNRLLRETIETRDVRNQLRTAREIQERLLPDGPATISGVQLAGMSEPFEKVGGDYFDYFPLDLDRVGLSIGDVSGHGIGPALIMSDVRAQLRSVLQLRGSLSGLYGILNRALYSDLGGGMFVSLFVAVYDRKHSRLEFQNAGHNPPLVYRPSTDTFDSIASNAPAFGLLDDLSAGPCPSVNLKLGDYLICYTDGVTETPRADGALYGEERLKAVVQKAVKSGRTAPEVMVPTIHADLEEYRGNLPPRDDVTLLVAKI